jgi:hypothetical protein
MPSPVEPDFGGISETFLDISGYFWTFLDIFGHFWTFFGTFLLTLAPGPTNNYVIYG